MTVSFNNLSQRESEALLDSIQKQAAGDTSQFVDISGDTMTGELNVPTVAITGAASITGPTNFGGLMTGGQLALTSAASLLGPLNVNGTITTTGVINSTATVNLTGELNLNAGVTLANPLIVGFGSNLGGPTIAPIQVIASTASQAFFDFRGAVISTASLNLTGAQMAGMIKVWIDGTGGANVGYLPIFKGVV